MKGCAIALIPADECCCLFTGNSKPLFFMKLRESSLHGLRHKKSVVCAMRHRARQALELVDIGLRRLLCPVHESRPVNKDLISDGFLRAFFLVNRFRRAKDYLSEFGNSLRLKVPLQS